MEKTGNVFADAMLAAGVQGEGDAFTVWASSKDYGFPFGLPREISPGGVLENGWTKIYNEVRRVAEPVDMGWFKDQNAVKTDGVLLTWMKSNKGMLRLVEDNKLSEAYRAEQDEIYKEYITFGKMPISYTSGLILYIKYKVIESRFVLCMDMRKARTRYSELCGKVAVIDILNWISSNRDIVEFIPIVIDLSFEISHRAYIQGKKEVPEVSVSYLGSGIANNKYAMDRLKGWFEEGNEIKPKNEYFILASKSNRSNCYLRRK